MVSRWSLDAEGILNTRLDEAEAMGRVGSPVWSCNTGEDSWNVYVAAGPLPLTHTLV